MSTIELKHIIYEHLSHIDDSSFLKAIKTIIETKANESVYQLSEEQVSRVESARKQLKNKETISHESLWAELENF